MSPYKVHQFTYNDDNYGFLLIDTQTGQTAAIDAGCDKSYLDALAHTGYQLTHIFITHHHWDHTDGLGALKEATNATIYAPKNTKQAIAAMADILLEDGDSISFGAHDIQVIATPGHTLDMMNFYLAEAGLVFSGDSLFVLGCGRLFEGDGPMMWDSLCKLLALPDETLVYSAHEYAASNAAFAEVIEPDNAVLMARIADIKTAREKNLPTVPSTIGQERETNPFCRADKPELQAHFGRGEHNSADIFTEIRRRKDVF